MKKAGKLFAFLILGMFAFSFLAGIASAGWPYAPIEKDGVQMGPDEEDAKQAAAVQKNLADLAAQGRLMTNNLLESIKVWLFDVKSGGGYIYFSEIVLPHLLIAALIFLVIYAVIGLVPLFQGNIKTAVALVIGALSSFFISPAWAMSLVDAYPALGILITALVPFAIIFLVMMNVAPDYPIVHQIVWGLYAFILLVHGIFVSQTSPVLISASENINIFYIIVQVFLIIAAGIMAWKSKKIIEFIQKEQIKAAVERRKAALTAGNIAQIDQWREQYIQLLGTRGIPKRNLDAFLDRLNDLEEVMGAELTRKAH